MADRDEKLVPLLRRCNNGENDACESLFKRCARIVRGYLLRRSYFRGWSDAIEDVTQQVFLKLWTGGLKNFRGTNDYQFLSYLRTTTVREGSDYIKEHPPPNGENGLDDRPDGGRRPDEQAELNELEECVNRYLQRYPLVDREIFWMVTKGYTYKEVGEVLGMPIATVAFRYSKVTDSLQKQLSDT